MNRRYYLATTLALAVAGCGDSEDTGEGNGNGGGDTATETENGADTDTSDADGGDENGVPAENQPTFQASDADAEGADGELEIAFNAAVYERLEDGDQFWEPDSGEAYLLGQYRVTNVGEQDVDLAGGQFDVTADGEEGEWTVVKDGSRFRVTLAPGDELNEWLVHTIPEGASEVAVSYDATEDVAATVEHDESIAFTWPET